MQTETGSQVAERMAETFGAERTARPNTWSLRSGDHYRRITWSGLRTGSLRLLIIEEESVQGKWVTRSAGVTHFEGAADALNHLIDRAGWLVVA